MKSELNGWTRGKVSVGKVIAVCKGGNFRVIGKVASVERKRVAITADGKRQGFKNGLTWSRVDDGAEWLTR